MRKDVQDIFRATPHNKQVKMFTATLSKEIRPVCKKFMHNVSFPLVFFSSFSFSLSSSPSLSSLLLVT